MKIFVLTFFSIFVFATTSLPTAFAKTDNEVAEVSGDDDPTRSNSETLAQYCPDCIKAAARAQRDNCTKSPGDCSANRFLADEQQQPNTSGDGSTK